MEIVPPQSASGKPSEFMASGGSPPGTPLALQLIEEDLAEIIAEALAADIQQYPVLEAIQEVADATANSPRGYNRGGSVDARPDGRDVAPRRRQSSRRDA
jgi:hypothetical protein